MQATYQGITFADSDVANPDDWNFGNYRPFLLHDHGFVIAVVFADHLQDAIDEAADRGKLDRYELSESESANYGPDGEGIDYLGNYDKPHDIGSLGAIELPRVPFSFVALFNARQ